MTRAERAAPRPSFAEAWADYIKGGQAGRLLAVVFVGGLAFNMQDVLLEPYGGDVLGLSVAATTTLTAVWAVGALIGFLWAAKGLGRMPTRSGWQVGGCLFGIFAFSAVILPGRCNSRRCSLRAPSASGWGWGCLP